MIFLLILALLGFGISVYAYFIEQKIKADPTYKALCDLSDAVSCTKTFASGYGNLFFVSNSLVGMAYYAIITLLALFQVYLLLMMVSLAGLLISIVLAYILFAKVKTSCLLCCSLYIINFIIFVLVLLKWY